MGLSERDLELAVLALKGRELQKFIKTGGGLLALVFGVFASVLLVIILCGYVKKLCKRKGFNHAAEKDYHNYLETQDKARSEMKKTKERGYFQPELVAAKAVATKQD